MFEWGDDDSSVSSERPAKDVAKIWAWVAQVNEANKPSAEREHLFDMGSCKVVTGLLEEGERFGLHIGGLSCYGNTVRKSQVAREVKKWTEDWGFDAKPLLGFYSDKITYINPAIESGKEWVRHNFKGDVGKLVQVKDEARKRGWKLYWMRDEKEAGGTMKMSDNLKSISAWFDDYRAQREESKPAYETFKDDLYEKFGPTVAYFERCTKAMYDNWKPATKRSWIAARMAELPDESPLVKHMRVEPDYKTIAQGLCIWMDKYWSVFTMQQDYKLFDDTDEMKLYIIMTMVIMRTSSRTNDIKTHGLWICGPKGVGKSVLTDFISGVKTRRKKIAGDSKGVGKFKCNSFQEVIIMDDIQPEVYKSNDYYQVINQLLDNTGTEVKIHSSTQLLINKYVVINSNDNICNIDKQPEKDENGDVIKYPPHPLRRRVFEVRIHQPMKLETATIIARINNDEDYKSEGDKLIWRWYFEARKAYKIETDIKLKDLQRIMDKQCLEEYKFE